MSDQEMCQFCVTSVRLWRREADWTGQKAASRASVAAGRLITWAELRTYEQQEMVPDVPTARALAEAFGICLEDAFAAELQRRADESASELRRRRQAVEEKRRSREQQRHDERLLRKQLGLDPFVPHPALEDRNPTWNELHPGPSSD